MSTTLRPRHTKVHVPSAPVPEERWVRILLWVNVGLALVALGLGLYLRS
jgi:hypothetical protein